MTKDKYTPTTKAMPVKCGAPLESGCNTPCRPEITVPLVTPHCDVNFRIEVRDKRTRRPIDGAAVTVALSTSADVGNTFQVVAEEVMSNLI